MKYVDLKRPKNTINQKPAGRKKSRKKRVALLLGVFASLVILPVILFSMDPSSLFNPISIVANVSASDLKETDGRTNVLVLGLDKRSVGYESTMLTDTILIASIGRVDKDIVLISLPRDLWVQNPQGFYEKINAMYYYGRSANPSRGADDIKHVVENVLGIPIHYHVVVDFNLFRDTIDILDGIEINVDTAFTDREYPVEGKEADLCGLPPEEVTEPEKKDDSDKSDKNKSDDKDSSEGKDGEEEEVEYISPLIKYPCRYQNITFEQGPQVMDGETALKYARSRHGNNNEGNDFARAKRQQKVIMAVKDKGLSLTTLINPNKMKELYETYMKSVDTNIDLITAQGFYVLSEKVDFTAIRSIVLDDRSASAEGGLLYAPTDTSLYQGRYVLIPRGGNFEQLHAYVQRYIFGER